MEAGVVANFRPQLFALHTAAERVKTGARPLGGPLESLGCRSQANRRSRKPCPDVLAFRECKEERASFPGSADSPNSASVRLDDRFRDEEPEPESGHVGTVELPVALENPFELVFFNSRSEVLDRDLDATVDSRQAHE